MFKRISFSMLQLGCPLCICPRILGKTMNLFLLFLCFSSNNSMFWCRKWFKPIWKLPRALGTSGLTLLHFPLTKEELFCSFLFIYLFFHFNDHIQTVNHELPTTNQLCSESYKTANSDRPDGPECPSMSEKPVLQKDTDNLPFQELESKKLLEAAEELGNLLNKDYQGGGGSQHSPPINNNQPLDQQHAFPWSSCSVQNFVQETLLTSISVLSPVLLLCNSFFGGVFRA